YVNFGFNRQPDGSVTLKCSPEHEARTYETGALHETWEELAHLTTPTWVLSGADQSQGPSSITPQTAATIAGPQIIKFDTPSTIAPLIAAAIPGSHFIKFDDLGHLGPMQDPARLAAIIRQIDTN
ncbi:MAG: hypothetical protein ABIQ38_07805, partial [Ilumatobacteraceae bacterium]